MRLKFAAATRLSYEEISALVDQYRQAGQIFNQRYKDLNDEILKVSRGEAQELRKKIWEPKNWNDRTPEDQELTENLPSQFGVGAFELLRDARKARRGIKHPENRAAILPFYDRWEPICTKFLELKPLIVKGRQPAENPSENMRTYENTGTCGICGRNIKMRRDKMVDHGYTKGWGWRNGNCFGVGFAPIETSNEVLIAYRDYCEKRIAALPENISRASDRVAEELKSFKEASTPENRERLFHAKRRLEELQMEFRAMPGVLADTNKRLKLWKARPLPLAK